MKRRSRAISKAVKARSRKTAHFKPRNTQTTAGSFRRLLDRVKRAQFPSHGDPTADWLRPFMTPKKYQKGEVVFSKGDVSKEMFLVETGRFPGSRNGRGTSARSLLWRSRFFRAWKFADYDRRMCR
jgi:hypothetical protein